MSKHVLSTMTNSVAYTIWGQAEGVPFPKRKVFIKGGALLPSETSGIGVMNKDEVGRPIWTPAGWCTTITDEEAELLNDHPVFKKHLEAGYVKFVANDINHNERAVEKAVNGMKYDSLKQLDSSTFNGRVKVKIDGEKG